MRLLLVLLAVCLLSCMAVPPTTGGVYHTALCTTLWQPSDFPLQLVVDRRLSPDNQQALQEAVVSWNDAVGAPVFSIEREIEWYDDEMLHPLHGNVYIRQADIPDDHDRQLQGLCQLTWDDFCHDQFAFITIDIATPQQDAMLVFKHELGHSLGLEHDNWQQSIMWPYAHESGGMVLTDDLMYVRWEMLHVYQTDSPVSESTSTHQSH